MLFHDAIISIPWTVFRALNTLLFMHSSLETIINNYRIVAKYVIPYLQRRWTENNNDVVSISQRGDAGSDKLIRAIIDKLFHAIIQSSFLGMGGKHVVVAIVCWIARYARVKWLYLSVYIDKICPVCGCTLGKTVHYYYRVTHLTRGLYNSSISSLRISVFISKQVQPRIIVLGRVFALIFSTVLFLFLFTDVFVSD